MPHRPDFILGAGVGPALARCEACDATPGVGVRGFMIFPVLLPLGLGVTVDHERFFSPQDGYTFAGPMLVFSSGFGRSWQAELWGAFGYAASVDPHPSGYGRPEFGLQAGFRLGRLIESRTRLSASISGASSFEGGTSAGGSSNSSETDGSEFVYGAILVAAELAYDFGPQRARSAAAHPDSAPAARARGSRDGSARFDGAVGAVETSSRRCREDDLRVGPVLRDRHLDWAPAKPPLKLE